MYKVYCDNELIYSPSEDLNLINPKVELEVNKAGSFDFTILQNHFCYDKIYKLKSEICVLQNDIEIFAGRPTDIDIDFMNRKKIHCEGELAYLNDSVQRPHEYKGVNVREYLKFIIDSHNAQVDSKKKFEVGAVSVKDSNDYLLRYTNWESTLSVLYDDLIKNLGGYFFIRKVDGTRYLDYLEDYNHTNTQKIEFGENMLDFSKNFDTTDIATCVIPLGARLENPKIEALGERVTIESVNNGVDSIISPEAVNIYGKITKTITYDNVTLPSNLKRKGEEYLKFVQWEKLTLQVKAIDLSFIDGSFEQFKIGEYVRVVSKPHGMDANFPLRKMSIKLDKISDNTVTLGNSKSVSLSSSSIEASSEIKKELDMLPKKYEVMKIAQDNATALLTKALGGFILKTENELLIMDTNSIDTAKNVWRWNINGLGYSKNGYEGPFETAITMDGAIVADFLTVGEIRGENFNLDLNKGVMKFGSGAIDSDALSSELKRELKGSDGKAPKIFFAYANDVNGGDFSIQNSDNRSYMGMYTSFDELQSTDYRQYRWVKVKGEDGTDATIYDWIKDWNGTLTMIDGKRVVSPRIYAGSSYSGVYINENGIMAKNGSDTTVQIKSDGSVVFGNKIDRQIIIDTSGNVTIPKVRTSEIKGDGRLNLDANGYASISMSGNDLEIRNNSATIRFNSDGIEIAQGSRVLKGGSGYAGLQVAYGTVMEMGNSESNMNIRGEYGFWASQNGTQVIRADTNGTYGFGYHNTSDAKTKENIKRFESGTEFLRVNKNKKITDITKEEVIKFIEDAKFYLYNFKHNDKTNLSIMTQDVMGNVRDVLVNKDKKTGFFGIDLYNYSSMLHVTLQEELKKTEELKKEVENLTQEISKIKELLNS
ncbi:phage tail protein [Peptostreptococcus canis]|uniref:Peptidase S74 domain-containing protein n=1 Tax=Peptostreptococcus canis TaxID=1159213 RepID=A0ABR6TIK5_9FIRM|nr:phage tail protein [Peptostreptococcus canis]MBC2575224.1 hypothetical protein [Peptostreptococcus canis]MBP1997599.1 hypothetical protein [Peptostreptococcus canis]